MMDRRRVDLPDITILGCTLHSRIPPEAEDIVRNKINDFHRIVDWTVSDHSEEHAAAVEWLENEISSIRQNDTRGLKWKVIVISHHALSTKGTSKPSDEGNPWSSAFATDLLGNKEESCLDDVQWWVFGHTHYCTESVRGQVNLMSNQRGYVLPGKNRDGTEGSGKFPSKRILKFWDSGSRHRSAFNPEKVIKV